MTSYGYSAETQAIRVAEEVQMLKKLHEEIESDKYLSILLC
ncbi:hypothetical protein [Desulfitispora alkaliphila]